ncbi:MAG TPA: helix-turn-helix domain-containing protein [Armatimonadota bacterium]|nr:helix-turn-helix domain-containing protein [Armatimonadota bacterium]
MPKQYTFSLTAEEQASLRALVQQRRATSPQLVRAQCLLAVATDGLGWTDAPSGQAYGVSTRTLERLRQRVCEAGVAAALRGQPRPHWPAGKYTGEVEAHLVASACSAPPQGRARWTLQRLAERLVALQVLPAASAAGVGRVLKKTSASRGSGRWG